VTATKEPPRYAIQFEVDVDRGRVSMVRFGRPTYLDNSDWVVVRVECFR
jgi:hypothetical protein